MTEDNGRYRAGRIDAKLDNLEKMIQQLLEEFRALRDWQRATDVRLAQGSERFEVHERTIEEIKQEQESLRKEQEAIRADDRRRLVLATAFGSGAGTFLALLVQWLTSLLNR